MVGSSSAAPAGTSGSDSSSLVSRLKAHDPSAWARFARVYGPLVLSWARRTGVQDSDAADVTQEVFQAVALAIDGFRHDRPADTFRGWLWTITRHKLADHARRAAQRPEATGGSEFHARLQQLPDHPPAGDQARSEQMDLARRALALIQNDFQETTWRAFWRTVIDGQPAAAVAQELGLSVGAVYAARSRVLIRLRGELADPLG